MNKFEIARLWQTTSPKDFLKILLHTPCKLITREVAKYIQFILNEIKKYIGISVVSGIKGLIPSKKDKVEPEYYDYTKTELFENQIKGLFQGLGIDKRYFAEVYQNQYNIVKEFLTEEYHDDPEKLEFVMESVCLTEEGSFQYTKPSELENGQPEKVELYVFSDKERNALEEYAYKNGHSKEKTEEAIIKEVGTHTLYDASNEIVNDFYQNLLLDRYAEQSNEERDTEEFTQETDVDVDEYQEVTIEDVKEMMRTLGLPYETVESFHMDENGEYSYVDFTSQNGGKVLAERVVTDTRLLKIVLQGIAKQVVPDVDEYLFEDSTKITELETKIKDLASYMDSYLQDISYSEDPRMRSSMRKTYADMEVELASMRNELALLEKESTARVQGTTSPNNDETRISALNERLQKEYNECSLTYEEFKSLCEECGLECEINPEKQMPQYIFQPAFVKVIPLNKTEMHSLIEYASSKGMNSETLRNGVASITINEEAVFLQSERAVLLNGGWHDLVQEWRMSLEKEIEEEKERLDVDSETTNNKWVSVKKDENPAIKKKILEEIKDNPDRANKIKVTFTVGSSQRGKETESHVAVRMPKGYFEKSQTGERTFVETSAENWGKYILIPKENIKELNKHSAEVTISMGQQFPLCDDAGNIIYADSEMQQEIMVSGISAANHFIISKMMEEAAPTKKRTIAIDGVKMEYVKSKSGFGFAYSEKEQKAVLLKYSGTEKDIKIPAEIKVNDVICVVTEIKDGVFEGLPIESLWVPDTITEIRNNVCKNCTELKSVKMSKNIKDIGSQVLRGCVNLESITANPGGNTYTHNNSLIIKQIEGEKLYTHAVNDKGDSFDIPATVTQIGDYAFEDCSIDAVTVPDGVVEIGNYAFSGCSKLSSVNIPSSVKNIGASAFRSATNLNDVDLYNVETIGSRAFADSGIKSVTLNNIKEVGALAFERCFLLADAHINTVYLTEESFAPSAFTRSDNLNIEFYKEEIKTPVHIGEYDEEEILSYVTNYLNNKFAEIDCPDLEFVDVCLYGSRSYGKETESSDLDVLVEYKGSIREDVLFNILHEDDLTLAGVSVDINPITEERSGTLAEYLERSKKYLKENIRQQELIDKINAAFNMEETTVEGVYNALVNMDASQHNAEYGNYASVEQYIKEIKESGFLDNTANTFAAYYDGIEETEAEVELHAVERALYFAKIDEFDVGIDESQEVYLERGNKRIKGKELYDYLLSHFKDDTNMSDSKAELKNLLESYAASYQSEIDYKGIVLFLIDKEEEKYDNTKRFNYYEKELLIEYAEMTRPQDVTELMALVQQLAQEGHGATISFAANPSLVSLVEKERLKYAYNEKANKLPIQPTHTDLEESTQPQKEEKEPTLENVAEKEKSFKEQLRDEVEAQLEIVGGYRKKYSKEERQSESIKADYEDAKKRLIDLTYDYINLGIGYHYQGDKSRLEVIEAVAMSHAKDISKTISNVDAKVEDLDKVIEEMSAEILEGIFRINDKERVSGSSEKTEQEAEEPEIQEPIGGVDENTFESIEEKVDESITNAAETEKSTFIKKETKIEDFGEKIGGARKELWKSRGLTLKDITELNEAERKEYITKDNIWKKPDYIHLIEEGLPVNVAYFYKTVRDAVKATPNIRINETNPVRIEEKQKQYIEFVTTVRDAVTEVKSTEEILAFKDKFLRDGGYIDFSNRYHPSPTEKCNGLMDNKLFQAMNVSGYDISGWEYEIKKKQFGIPPEKKLPAGIIIKKNQENTFHRGKPVKAGTWYIKKGSTILADEIPSHEEAFKLAKEIGKKIRGNAKKALIPPQLEHIQRTGLEDVLQNNNATGEMYLNTFEFKGGEFGNYMSEKDRQASLNMGYEALCDLATALDISPKDISLNNRLSIAFGARGQGNAVAHYEPLREVINLTKMRGAGSLAHEWGHALDFITRQGDMATESVSAVLQKMKYREATIEEKQSHLQKQIEHSEKQLREHLSNMLPERRLTEEQIQKRTVLIQELLENPNKEAIEKLSSFKKQTLGHVISKQDRETLGFYVRDLQIHKDSNMDFPLRIETEYYKNAKRLDSLCSKCDKGYWAEDVEIFARAFACYVNDKLAEKGGRSDYLCGHCESCVTFDMNRKGEMSVVKGFPEGEERKVINEGFDQMIREYKELGYLHEPENEQHIAREEIAENEQYELNLDM